jgi:hypothetical protein
MGSKFRHFKALMRKNWINWKRTPIGSAVEMLTPALLMILLVIARKAMKIQVVNSVDLADLQHPRFPIANYNSTTGSWNVNGVAMQSYMLDKSFQGMMQYANYTNNQTKSEPVYNPLLDVKGPFLFNPPHCTKHSIVGFDSPIIAYIKSDSSLQKDMVLQLKELFKNQRQMAEYLKTQQS